MSLPPGLQSALAPYGAEAIGIARTSWLLIGGSVLIFVVVLALATIALLRPPRWLGSHRTVVVGGIVFPSVVLTALLVHSLFDVPRLVAVTTRADVVIEVVGEQWWWRVRYLDAEGRPAFATANELRLPAGGIVELRLDSADVLHSFWVPSLAGKMDTIPGRTNRLTFAAGEPGTFRGQCAEFCGGPHAQMALYVVVESQQAFERWRDAQRAHASKRANGTPGEAIFLRNCAVCHTVRGTDAGGILGPDLTHVASRLSLGAGILVNDVATLERWIVSNQRIKPGNLMPEFRAFAPGEVRALAEYLSSLD